MYGKSRPLFSRILPAKSYTSGTVLSTGDPGVGAHQGEGGRVCLGSAHTLQVSSKPAQYVQVPVEKLLLDYLCLLYKAEGGGGWRDRAPHHPHEDMGDKFRFECV